jgi:hypothetical protein
MEMALNADCAAIESVFTAKTDEMQKLRAHVHRTYAGG